MRDMRMLFSIIYFSHLAQLLPYYFPDAPQQLKKKKKAFTFNFLKNLNPSWCF